MSWIEVIEPADADERLKQLYDRIAGPNGNIDNIMMAHSLRPHTMEGHMALYKAALHHARNQTPKWFLETLGVWVSMLNDCSYCVHHHATGVRRLLGDDSRTDAIIAALQARDIAKGGFDAAQSAALRYAETLTIAPHDVDEAMVEAMRAAGLSDGEILEVNQVCAYFAYANRTVLGLGCSTEREVIGQSPGNSEDPNDWAHA